MASFKIDSAMRNAMRNAANTDYNGINLNALVASFDDAVPSSPSRTDLTDILRASVAELLKIHYDAVTPGMRDRAKQFSYVYLHTGAYGEYTVENLVEWLRPHADAIRESDAG